ncbi:MAG: alpha-N-acetylglucosaminidase C-terminal domain-containing protein [Bacteroidales bacterium]|nr:alpha-N-acetylglucosaminidase C-terminal domain-containing protein [Bacteroidales bacterium]
MNAGKILFTIGCTAVIISCSASAVPTDGSEGADAAKAVIERTFGRFPSNVHFEIFSPGDSSLRYTTEVSGGVLTVRGSTPVAICRGFYDYVLRGGYGIASWTGNRLDLPRRLPDEAEREVVSPYRMHLYQNVCTYGYTYPFWGWEEWENEIDWMALHGFDMPLSPIGGETILSRVWKGMGLSDKEIKEYFTGPAHLPWMRMGNMAHYCGGMSDEWFDAQIALEHRIDGRERELGMTPVYQGFAGFVPAAFVEHFPQADITETIWSKLNPEDHNHMLSPLDPLFKQVGVDFIREWEKEFGKGKYYLIDSFNEMKVPFGPLGSKERSENLRLYSQKLYDTVREADPDAVWVLQGWMFGYQRDKEWDSESVRALLGGAPDGKLLVIDLAVDFNEFVWKNEKSWDCFNGFFGKDWIWSTTPNFGGRTGLVGTLDFLLNGHLDAYGSPNKGNPVGYGTSPEGVESNEIVYEVISAGGWSDSRIDLDSFLEDYTRARYGKTTPALATFWKEMLQSRYGIFTNNARFRWQHRPSTRRPHSIPSNDHYFKAIESFIGDRDNFKGNRLYEIDAIGYCGMYLAGKADRVLDSLFAAVARNEPGKAANGETLLLEILSDLDRILESHPVWRTQRWLDFARAAAFSPSEADSFELEAKKLISIWGGRSLHDYSARMWSGLVRDYYIPRLKYYFDTVIAGEEPDMAAFDNSGFPEELGLSPRQPFRSPVKAAADLVEKYKDMAGLPH